MDRVGSDNLFLQYDIYHMQVVEGDLARTIEKHLDRIAHIQIADNPGRNEPGTGEINYDFLLGHPRPHRLCRLGGRRIQAGGGHRGRARLDEAVAAGRHASPFSFFSAFRSFHEGHRRCGARIFPSWMM